MLNGHILATLSKKVTWWPHIQLKTNKLRGVLQTVELTHPLVDGCVVTILTTRTTTVNLKRKPYINSGRSGQSEDVDGALHEQVRQQQLSPVESDRHRRSPDWGSLCQREIRAAGAHIVIASSDLCLRGCTDAHQSPASLTHAKFHIKYTCSYRDL